jgi:hypothetical protein
MTDTLTGLGAGDYIIAVTGHKGCVQNSLVTLVDSLPLLIDTVVTPSHLRQLKGWCYHCTRYRGYPGLYVYMGTE